MAGENYSLITSAAYKLFVEELERHLTDSKSIMQTSASLSDDQRKKLGAAFHTIRGGAGFFKLSEIASVSQDLEELFLDLGLAEAEIRPSADELIKKLTELEQKLPRPGS